LDILLIATQRQRQNVEPGTSHRCAPLVLTGVREPRAPLSTKRRAPAGVQYTVLCRLRSSFDGHNTVWGSPGNGLPEKCATATKQAVETPERGRDHPSRTNASRHRRAASRSKGATSAERDGRPVERRIGLRGDPPPWNATCRRRAEISATAHARCGGFGYNRSSSFSDLNMSSWTRVRGSLSP
jgi:hypothetical protein